MGQETVPLTDLHLRTRHASVLRQHDKGIGTILQESLMFQSRVIFSAFENRLGVFESLFFLLFRAFF